MIQDNQKNFSRLQMLIDAIVIAVTYVLAWMIRFIGPFAYSAVRALAFEEYMFSIDIYHTGVSASVSGIYFI